VHVSYRLLNYFIGYAADPEFINSVDVVIGNLALGICKDSLFRIVGEMTDIPCLS
jgi:hypothetical protein